MQPKQKKEENMTEDLSRSNPEDGLHALIHSQSSTHRHLMSAVKILMVYL